MSDDVRETILTNDQSVADPAKVTDDCENGRERVEHEVGQKVRAALDRANSAAEQIFAAKADPPWNLGERIRTSIATMSAKSEGAKAAFTNVITGLAIKSAIPELDVRKYKVEMGAQFSHRRVSEEVVVPFLAAQEFVYAPSGGWQTRTLERTTPYTMDYPENIGSVKKEFLAIYDEVSEKEADAAAALEYLFYLQMEMREKKRIRLATPQTGLIQTIIGLFESHFFYGYKGVSGASRLPVLAIYAVYEVLMAQFKRYDGMLLRPLQKHSAADEQTGAIGDIEVETPAHEIFEAVEIKHDIIIDGDIIDTAVRKFAPTGVKRYYILTSHRDCRPSEDILAALKDKQERTGVQIIVNGVLPTVAYYLRLLDDPSKVFVHYTKLLESDGAIAFEHRQAWNNIVAGGKPKARRR
jgi:DNA (cytosine-5)-methyltransferase 1